MTNLLQTPQGHFTGWRPSPVDPRDHVTVTNELAPPDEYDPRGETPAIDNQAELGACTANATTRAFRYAFTLADADPGAFSRLWAYAQTRYLEGGWKQFAEDSGAFGRDDFKIARHLGLILETDWDYSDYKDTFNDKSLFQSLKNKVLSTERYFLDSYSHPHPDALTFQQVLSSKKIVPFGFPVYESFESESTARTGIVSVPRRNERVIGGHEIAFEGYVKLNGKRYWLAANNWDVTWGDKGYCYFPDEYMFQYGMSDYRVVDSVKGVN